MSSIFPRSGALHLTLTQPRLVALHEHPDLLSISLKRCKLGMDAQLYKAHVYKFSAKPPGYDAARQRENQRRHRARVKNRIVELEAALSATQHKLQEALMQIESLTNEVRRLRCALGSAQEVPVEPLSSIPESPTTKSIPPCQPLNPNDASIDGVVVSPHALCQIKPQAIPSSTSPSGVFCYPLTVAPTTEGSPLSHAPLPLNIQAPTSSASETFCEHNNDDGPLLPPPGKDESTITCREAFLIIKDRCHAAAAPDVDLDAAAEFLRPGFRRAIAPGTGCRVETHLLFAFVDRIVPD
mgnify:CR=1 FL=1